MQTPLPGPNVMLPVIRLSDSPNLDCHISFKKREAEWKQLVSKSHRDWCLCGSYLNHFLPPEKPLKQCSDVEDGDAGQRSVGVGDEDIADGAVGEDIVAGDDWGYISDLSLKMCLEDIDTFGLEDGNL
nr:ORF2 [Torque teno felis virus]